MRLCLLPAALVFAASPSLADLQVRFAEGAPKDRFTISNIGGCALGATTVTIDLRGSPFGLIFDVTGSGAGVEVFQPFEISGGGANLRASPKVLDGDNVLTLDLLGLAAGESFSFTIDIDDTANSQETIVSGTEILGAEVIAQAGIGKAAASFKESATALVELSSCTS